MGCLQDDQPVVEELVQSKAARKYLNGRVVITLSSRASGRVVCLIRCQRKRDESTGVDQNSIDDEV